MTFGINSIHCIQQYPHHTEWECQKLEKLLLLFACRIESADKASNYSQSSTNSMSSWEIQNVKKNKSKCQFSFCLQIASIRRNSIELKVNMTNVSDKLPKNYQ
jgi:hypothetical protein